MTLHFTFLKTACVNFIMQASWEELRFHLPVKYFFQVMEDTLDDDDRRIIQGKMYTYSLF